MAAKTPAPLVPATSYAPPAWFAKCRDPWGAALARPGFSHSPEMDRAFALGWPHAVELKTGLADDKDPSAHAAQSKSYGAVWPAKVAVRWARLRACRGYHRTPQGELELEPKGVKAVSVGGPIGAAECKGLLLQLLGGTDHAEDLRDMARIFEASAGPDVFCVAATEALEAADPKALAHDDAERGFVVEHLGFALLRADRTLVQDLRARLTKLAATLAAGPRDSAQIRTLHLIVGGKAAAEQCAEREGNATVAGKLVAGTRLSVHDLRHVHDDAAFVAAAVSAQDPKFLLADPRLVFLSTPAVINFYVEHVKQLRADPLRTVAEMGAIRHPNTAKLMTQVAKFRDAKVAANAWLAAYA